MTAKRTYRIASIPGDGIGKEVIPEGLRVLAAAASKFGFELQGPCCSNPLIGGASDAG